MSLPRFLAFSLAAAGLEAQAARPLITDDARVVDAKACQVESWTRRNRDSTEFWALPGCNPFGNLELTFGGARTREGGDGSRLTDVVLQAKTLFKPFEEGGWGWGLAVGAVRKPAREIDRSVADPYAYIPVSAAVPGTPTILHVNLGAAKQRDVRRTVTTWGVGSETALGERAYFVAETFGQNRERAFYQLGVRFWIVKDRMQVDTTYGNRGAGSADDRWVSVGLRLLSPPFLP